jgi:outer membrane protein insertion porin family
MLKACTKAIIIVLLLMCNCLAETSSTPEYTGIVQSKEDVEEIKMVFEGNKIFSREELLKAMKFDEYPFQSIEKVSVNLQCLKVFLGDQGYINPSIGEPELINAGNGRLIKVKFDEGLKYYFGEIEVEGATIFSLKQILDFSGIRTGNIASAKIIRKGVFERISKKYSELGYIQATIDLSQEFKPLQVNTNEGIVNFVIHIDQGKPFYINKIIFKGNKRQSNQLLLKELLFNKGEIYNQTLVDRSRDRLNKMGIFQPITEEDIQLISQGKDAFLDVIIQVKEK